MFPLVRVGRAILLSLLALSTQSCSSESPEGCTPVDASHASGYSKIFIREAGRYCLTQDIHARVEFADRPAEAVLIQIGVSGVHLDLGGHTLGRGRLFRNPGGIGIEIAPRAADIVISNGTLRDFSAALFIHPGTLPEPTYDRASDTYTFHSRSIVLEKLKFERNKRNVQ